ncbi:peptidase C39-like protein [Melghirimyces profundicolus]|uniref:Peptidase C39-like protein n=1 Tax=Melghirimyces profundicolus TaxID=1242148 RepID=A0A2T6BSI5_9BACL|nr:peptidase C39 family protein [Melghirimyces profundicolus]PTX58907.1 peptidase C39-like protein [Melghirimyces profundicolus]
MKRKIVFAVLVLGLVFGGWTPGAEAKEKTGGEKSYHEVSNFTGGRYEGTKEEGGLALDPGSAMREKDAAGKYNGGTYYYGRWTAPVHAVSFEEAIASWQAVTPKGTWMEVELKARTKKGWTKWYSMGVWHEHDQPFQRHSVRGQGDRDGYVAVDTLKLKKSATAVRARVTLFTEDLSQTPVLRSYGIAFSKGKDKPGRVPSRGATPALDVPMRSQMVYPDGGEVWCSPTSTSMVMAYWANVTGNRDWDQRVPEVVEGVWDYVYDGGGNWPFNTAYAASKGLEGKVVRLSSLAEVERWVRAEVPVIISLGYKEGELTGSPIPSSPGHLLVIRGFDDKGNVLTNDPAGPSNESVRITYDRGEMERLWLEHSNGTVYLIHPRGWKTPDLR